MSKDHVNVETHYWYDHVSGITKDERLTAEEMDSLRNQATAYEYLCHLEEAKRFVYVV